VVILEIPREQDALPPDAHAQHDRRAVDGAAVGEDPVGESLRRWPKHVDPGVAEDEPIALDQTGTREALPQRRGAQLQHAAALRVHLRLHDAVDAIARHQPGEATGVVLVWMGQQRDVDVAIPRRDALVEPAHEQVRVGPAVHEQAVPVGRFEQDRVALTDIEQAHRQRRARSSHEHDGGRAHEQDADDDRRQARSASRVG
jgi:hypothetical protein